jgi:hypothetical protein
MIASIGMEVSERMSEVERYSPQHAEKQSDEFNTKTVTMT